MKSKIMKLGDIFYSCNGDKLPVFYDVKGQSPRIMYSHTLKKVILESNKIYDEFTNDNAFK